MNKVNNLSTKELCKIHTDRLVMVVPPLRRLEKLEHVFLQNMSLLLTEWAGEMACIEVNLYMNS